MTMQFLRQRYSAIISCLLFIVLYMQHWYNSDNNGVGTVGTVESGVLEPRRISSKMRFSRGFDNPQRQDQGSRSRGPIRRAPDSDPSNIEDLDAQLNAFAEALAVAEAYKSNSRACITAFSTILCPLNQTSSYPASTSPPSISSPISNASSLTLASKAKAERSSSYISSPQHVTSPPKPMEGTPISSFPDSLLSPVSSKSGQYEVQTLSNIRGSANSYSSTSTTGEGEDPSWTDKSSLTYL